VLRKLRKRQKTSGRNVALFRSWLSRYGGVPVGAPGRLLHQKALSGMRLERKIPFQFGSVQGQTAVAAPNPFRRVIIAGAHGAQLKRSLLA